MAPKERDTKHIRQSKTYKYKQKKYNVLIFALFWFDTLNLDLFIVYIDGLQVILSKEIIVAFAFNNKHCRHWLNAAFVRNGLKEKRENQLLNIYLQSEMT